jgi:exonuclease VII small subunit
MAIQETPQRNSYLVPGVLAGLIVLCMVCLGGGVFTYYYTPLFNDQAAQAETATPTPSPELTPTSVLDNVLTNQINQAVPGGPNFSRPGAEATLTPTVTPTTSLKLPAHLSDTAAADYASFLMVDGSVFILDDIAQQLESGQLNQAEVDQILAAIEAVLDLIERALAEPPSVEAPVSAVTAWSEATIILAKLGDLLRAWQAGEITIVEVNTRLASTQEQVEGMLTAAENAYNQQYGVDLSSTRQARAAEVRAQLLASVLIVLQPVSTTLEASAALTTPVVLRYREDIPLSNNLSSALAIRYVNHILTMMENFPDAYIKLNELKAQSPGPLGPDMRYRSMVAEMGTVRASSRIIKDTELPVSLANVREILRTALIACDNAAFYLASGLSDTPDDFETGLAYLDQCNERLVQPRQALEAYVEDQGGQPVTKASETTEETEPAPLTVACPEGCVELLPGCIIKGQVTDKGYKVYYLPGDLLYGEIQIDSAQGGRWFCTVEEAIANSWLSGVG